MQRTTILLVVALTLVTAACSGSDDGAEVATLSGADPGSSAAAEIDAAPVDVEAAMMAFTECIREQGVDIADPTVDADGNVRPGRPQVNGEGTFDRSTVEAAREACGSYLEGVTLGFQGEDRTAIQDQLLEYAACMRENGYDMADPDLTAERTPGQGGGIFRDLDREDPTFVAADAVCRDLFTEFGGRGGGVGGGAPPAGGEGS